MTHQNTAVNATPIPRCEEGLKKLHDFYVNKALLSFVEEELLPGTGIDGDQFWESLHQLEQEFGPKNRLLICKRKRLQRAMTPLPGKTESGYAPERDAAVDANEKIEMYRNMLELFQGNLQVSFSKGGDNCVRELNPDRQYLPPEHTPLSLQERNLLLVRNVGHLMTTPAVLDDACCEIPEGILDGFVTAIAGLRDLRKSSNDPIRNCHRDSIYIVKPTMHGAEEVAFCNELFARIEDLVGLERCTLKVGLFGGLSTH